MSPRTSLYSLALSSYIKWGFYSITDLMYLPTCVKDDVLHALLMRRILFKSWENLLHSKIEKLDFTGIQLTPNDILSISKCEQLKILEMNATTYFSFCYPSDVLEYMFSRLPNLVKVGIQGNRGVTDYVISVMTTQCPKLRYLDISRCSSLTAQVGIYISKLKELKALNLSNTDVSDQTLAWISEGNSCDSLEELRLNSCVRITDVGIRVLLTSFKQLSVLLLSNCPLVSVDCQFDIDSTLNKGCKKKKVISWSLYL